MRTRRKICALCLGVAQFCSNDTRKKVPNGYNESPTAGKYYKIFTDTKIYLEAEKACQADQGRLATFKNFDEIDFVLNQLDTGSRSWIGLTLPNSKGQTPAPEDLRWIDGTDFEPGLLPYNPNLDHTCGQIRPQDADFYLESCYNRYRYVCEFDCSAVNSPPNTCPNGRSFNAEVIRLTLHGEEQLLHISNDRMTFVEALGYCNGLGGEYFSPSTESGFQALRFMAEIANKAMYAPWIALKQGKCNGMACNKIYVDYKGQPLEMNLLISSTNAKVNRFRYGFMGCIKTRNYVAHQEYYFLDEDCYNKHHALCKFSCEQEPLLGDICPNSGKSIPENAVQVNGHIFYPPLSKFEDQTFAVRAMQNCLAKGGRLYQPKTSADITTLQMMMSLIGTTVGLPLTKYSYGACSGAACDGLIQWFYDSDSPFNVTDFSNYSITFQNTDSYCLTSQRFTITAKTCSSQLRYICELDCDDYQETTCPNGQPLPDGTISLNSGLKVFSAYNSIPTNIIRECTRQGGEVFIPKTVDEISSFRLYAGLHVNHVFFPFMKTSAQACFDCDGRVNALDGHSFVQSQWSDRYDISFDLNTYQCATIQYSNVRSTYCQNTIYWAACRFDCANSNYELKLECANDLRVSPDIGFILASANTPHGSAVASCNSDGKTLIRIRSREEYFAVFNALTLLTPPANNPNHVSAWADLENFANADCLEAACLKSTMRWTDGSDFDPSQIDGITFGMVHITASHGNRIYLELTDDMTTYVVSLLSPNQNKPAVCQRESKHCKLYDCESEPHPISNAATDWNGKPMPSGEEIRGS